MLFPWVGMILTTSTFQSSNDCQGKKRWPYGYSARLKPEQSEAFPWPGFETNLGQVILFLYDLVIAMGGGKKRKKWRCSFVSGKCIFQSSLHNKGYFCQKTFQKGAGRLRLPVCMEVHSEISRPLQTLLQLAVMSGMLFPLDFQYNRGIF